MANNSISARVLDAASVTLPGPIRVYGRNSYVISSDFISWNDAHNHTISDIAADFGKRVNGAGDEIFTCGDDKISVYDFGLLYTIFTAMTTAQAELGTDLKTEETSTSKEDIHVLWIGNEVIIYSAVNNLIIPIDSGDIKRACAGERLECGNFCNKDKYHVDRERVELFITDVQKKELLCRLRICTNTQKCYAEFFEQPTQQNKESMAPWDVDSALGRLAASIEAKFPSKDIFAKYRKSGTVESVTRREDLIVTPTQTYSEMRTEEDLRKFFGSVCYTDKDAAVIAVNFHTGMLVYSPCFPGDYDEGLLTDTTPDFGKFYNISKPCESIMRFANTVANVPLTPAQLDIRVYNKIADALVEHSVRRVSFVSCLGRVVIPESVMETAFSEGFGADLFCMVPVGKIGEIVVCKTATGKLESVYPRGWTTDEAFYDVTEVVANVER